MTPPTALFILCLTLIAMWLFTWTFDHIRRSRRLIAAAGGHKEAERELVAIQACRDVNAAIKAKERRRAKVLPFPPIVSRGRPLHFDDKESA